MLALFAVPTAELSISVHEWAHLSNMPNTPQRPIPIGYAEYHLWCRLVAGTSLLQIIYRLLCQPGGQVGDAL
jgi:hypothetical protein